VIDTAVLPQRPDRKAYATVQLAEASHAPADAVAAASLGNRFLARLKAQGPHIRRTLPRDLSIMLILFMVTRFLGLGVVMTDSVHTRLALVIKGASPKVGQLAVFAYSGGMLPGYYPDGWMADARRALGMHVSLDGPRKDDGFIKYLAGVAGDRIEVESGHVFLINASGRHDMGACKPTTRHGVQLHPIAPQVIPPGYVYVYAPHVDALDSRYSVMGLVPTGAIVGRGVALW
jgi:hypothetical protein